MNGRGWLPQNLYLRVLLAMVTSIAVVVAIVTAVSTAISEERLKGDMLARGEHYSHILSQTAGVYVAQHDSHQLLQTARAATDGGQVQFVAFFAQNGELLAAAAAPQAEPGLRTSFGDLPAAARDSGRVVMHWTPLSLELAQPIVYQGRPVGTLALRVRTAVLAESFRWEVLRNLVLALTLMACISVVVGLLLHKLVITPLRRLSATADQISAGRLVVPPGQERPDELGRVARSFSRMVSVLQARDTQIALFVRADDGRIFEANHAAAVAYGYEHEDLLRRHIFDLQVADEGGDVVTQLGRWPVTGLVFETTHRRSDGSTFAVEVTARSALIDGVRLIIADIRDISERKQAEAALAAERTLLARRVEERTADLSASNAQLARALRLKDEFLAMMSHELRTPLNAVLGITEALDLEVYGPISREQRRALATVAKSGSHLLAILSDILDLTRIEAGVERLDLAPIDLAVLCRSAIAFVRPVAIEKGIVINYADDGGEVSVRVDERRLTQILVNLLDNAVKFTPAGGAVGLEVRPDPFHERLQLRVWDTGIGIAETEISRLFQPFTQVDGRLSRTYGGIGLGLTLVRRLVDLHGGSVSLATAPGKGSTFTVSLPWPATTPLTPVPLVREEAPGTWGEPPLVVVADDHEITLSFYADMLARQGYRVASARSGEEVLAVVRVQHPDVVLLDIQMPGMDGLTVMRQIRADPRVADVPIIALTALAMPGDRERCLEAGATRYLAKPVGLRVLIGTIVELHRSVAGEPL